MVRKAHRLTRPTRAGQDVPFLGQGRSRAYRIPERATVVAKQSVYGVREHDNGPRRPLADPALSRGPAFSTGL